MVSYKHIPTIYFPRTKKNQKEVKIIFTKKKEMQKDKTRVVSCVF